jgi:hypothetical protein
MSEIRDQGSEVRDQRSEVRDQRSVVLAALPDAQPRTLGKLLARELTSDLQYLASDLWPLTSDICESVCKQA